MLLEDDPTMLSLLETLLEIEGYVVFHTIDFDEAVARVSEVDPDLLIMDVNLRNANGLEVLKDMRADNGLMGTLVIMSSGMDLHTECIEKGADDFILKPYMPDELVKKIEELLEAREGRLNTK